MANVTAPNWHRKARTLKEWNRVPLSDDHVWPSPREADDQEYSEEEDAEDVSGRGTETGTHNSVHNSVQISRKCSRTRIDRGDGIFQNEIS